MKPQPALSECRRSPFEEIATSPGTDEVIKIGRTRFAELPESRQIEIQESRWRIVETYREAAQKWLAGYCRKNNISGDAHFDMYGDLILKLVNGELRSFERYDPKTGVPRRFRDFLLGVIKNQARDFCRKNKRLIQHIGDYEATDTRDLDRVYHDDLDLVAKVRRTLQTQACRKNDPNILVRRFAQQCANADKILETLKNLACEEIFEDRVLPNVAARFPGLNHTELQELCDRLADAAYEARLEMTTPVLRKQRIDMLRTSFPKVSRGARKKLCAAFKYGQSLEAFEAAGKVGEVNRHQLLEIHRLFGEMELTPDKQIAAIRSSQIRILSAYTEGSQETDWETFLDEFDKAYRTEKTSNESLYERWGELAPSTIRKRKERAVGLLFDFILIELANQDGKGIADWKLKSSAGGFGSTHGLLLDEQQAFVRVLVEAAQAEPVIGDFLLKHLDAAAVQDGFVLRYSDEDAANLHRKRKPQDLNGNNKRQETLVERLLRYQRLIETPPENPAR